MKERAKEKEKKKDKKGRRVFFVFVFLTAPNWD